MNISISDAIRVRSVLRVFCVISVLVAVASLSEITFQRFIMPFSNGSLSTVVSASFGVSVGAILFFLWQLISMERYIRNSKKVEILDKMSVDNKDGKIAMFKKSTCAKTKVIDVGTYVFYYTVGDQKDIDFSIG